MEQEFNLQFVDFQYTPQQFESSDTEESKQQQQSTDYNSDDYLENSSKQTQARDLVVQNKQPNWNYVYINPNLNDFNQTFSLFNGFTVTNEGAIRFNYILDQVSFGYWQQKVLQVAELHKLGIVDISYSRDKMYKNNQYSEALNFLKYVPNLDFQKVSAVLTQTEQVIKGLKAFLQSVVPEDMRDVKDLEYQLYLKHCFTYLEYFCQNNPNQMFYYAILRFNLHEGDSEIAHTGYSKSYLQLLGIESSSLSQIIMRNKRVDLIKDKVDISLIGLQGVLNMTANLKEEYYESQINTFDGFPIKLKFKRQHVNHGFEANKIPLIECQYGFVIVEIDVDMYDLQQLIEYRQRLIQNQLNYEDYLKKELSLLYEDVEYSVQSQIFIEKYYVQNIEQLKELKSQKLKDRYQYNYKMLTM
ncbi:hypothetical protein TTHERM_00327230 (macronuclear) [Tetrahymena thermophila SB210]|uniref:Uncharacterized protein n=1 Tax=Tetrahymena thermophila (strain SB210) TaxID=312017 RepID=I7LXV0_TETTS|nr:hypothetical protein TTHERM_00327230 [Tetrahymena thermophila SB210]EAS06241.1 hypothetical protein TTHERM_00327230 [Tetrahymena thermophila SB210]|eukprot:XP_001026486.1 hypothetical protein TTHERM_00327230 [Tetrahymena thermophila SB210]